MHTLRGGYRVVRLRAPTGSRLRGGALLLRIELDRLCGGDAAAVPQNRRRSLQAIGDLIGRNSMRG